MPKQPLFLVPGLGVSPLSGDLPATMPDLSGAMTLPSINTLKLMDRFLVAASVSGWRRANPL